MVDKNDINELLDTWYNTKLKISHLQKKCDKYKQYCEKIMNKIDKNSLTTVDYDLKRVSSNRSSVSKKDLPKDIWDKYSNEVTFSSFYLKPKKKLPKK
jgi:hypothetical protein